MASSERPLGLIFPLPLSLSPVFSLSPLSWEFTALAVSSHWWSGAAQVPADRLQRVSKHQNPGPWGARRRHWQGGQQDLTWPIVVDLAYNDPILACKSHGSSSQVTMSSILGVLRDDSPKNWPEHDMSLVRDFDWPFLYPRSSPELETGTYQLVSLKALIS